MRILVAAVLALAVSACGPVPDVKDVIVECAQTDQDALADLSVELLPLLNLDAPNWVQLEKVAIAHGLEIGGCALSRLLNDWLSRPRATPDTIKAHETLERVRKHFGANVSWRVAGAAL